ncbi:MAG: alpha-glucan family phosphorylase [candidate division Zixibacteria bacterium]|nr:alpha-glucan family phosphorylase [candidate division Zixibacteria bacterium]
MMNDPTKNIAKDLITEPGINHNVESKLSWYQKALERNEIAPESGGKIAYFCAEFGLDPKLPIYTGGLGILAGDHLKSAAELGLPLIGIGILYRHKAFEQKLTPAGVQEERYNEIIKEQLPLTEIRGVDNSLLIGEAPLGERSLKFKIWRYPVGVNSLYLLDVDIPENPQEFREITSRIYPGDKTLRLQQEILLGIGGMRALRLLKIEPNVIHINEGHALFSIFEKARQNMAPAELSFSASLERLQPSVIFTTHTPTPAGNEVFDPVELRKALGKYVESFGILWESWLDYGRVNQGDSSEWFSMTCAALRVADKSNAVSALHGQTSRGMWRMLWPEIPEDKVPIDSVTNGVHVGTWMAPQIKALITNTDQSRRPDEIAVESIVEENAQAIQSIPNENLWNTHQSLKSELLEEVARRSGVNFDHTALTIGFARRFTTYKRGALIFSDMNRLSKILRNQKRPAQILIAGKAHPMDQDGKALIREIVEKSRDERLMGRVLFLENYNMNLAMALVAGCDIWLNNPRRPEEASGTSGMKAGLNGCLNFSVLDGWWAEAYDKNIGWKIGSGENHDKSLEEDSRDSQEIYDTLENEILPLFFKRDQNGLPADWLERMKRSIALTTERFSSRRMVCEYAERFYLPAIKSRK